MILLRFVTKGEGGGSKKAKNRVTYFMNGPFRVSPLSIIPLKKKGKGGAIFLHFKGLYLTLTSQTREYIFEQSKKKSFFCR